MNPGPVLRDIHLPAEPGWWPPAPGWWALALVLLALLAWWARRAWRVRRRRRLLRALDALVAASAGRHGPTDGAALAAELSMLLRRAARLHDRAAAALQGDAWLRWLDGDDPAAPFSRGPGRLLVDAPFRPAVPRAQVEPLLPLVRRRLRSIAAEADRG